MQHLAVVRETQAGSQLQGSKAPQVPLHFSDRSPKKKEQEAFSALPLVGNRARRAVGRFQMITAGTPVGSQPPPAKWPSEREAAQTLKSEVGSARLQNELSTCQERPVIH
jgi:hypothetical protein